MAARKSTSNPLASTNSLPAGRLLVRPIMNPNEKTLQALHDLVATNNDAAEGYAKAAKGVHDTDLSNWLAQASDDRGRFAGELSKAIKDMGGEPRLDLHEGGILHKGWVDLRHASVPPPNICTRRTTRKSCESAWPAIPRPHRTTITPLLKN